MGYNYSQFLLVGSGQLAVANCLLPAIIRSFTGDGYIMGMPLNHPSGRDPDELALFEFFDVFRAAVAHSGTEATGELVEHFGHVSFEWYPPRNAFRNEFLDIIFYVLEVAILGTFLHCFNGAHSAIRFELPSFVNDHFARRFLGSGQQ